MKTKTSNAADASAMRLFGERRPLWKKVIGPVARKMLEALRVSENKEDEKFKAQMDAEGYVVIGGASCHVLLPKERD